ncbi:NADPH dehydrogenase [Cladorrhinum samala]|uniref:NADPH dehydrogenase n=1 Tax=Cladorrhinum samala TaxID=585594 RepID=A0AAV9I239_9PEZI|nr:NADPH dehydrogenase [Cladorrhinum samala]
MTSPSPQDLQIAQPLTLKCGLTLPNRLVKAAMAEWLSEKSTSLPSEKLNSLSKHWADGGWGMQITGNIEVDPRHVGSPDDVAIDPSVPVDTILPSFARWARSFGTGSPKDGPGGKKTPVLVQINHPGRQSPRGAGTRGLFAQTVGPSAVPINWGPGIVPTLLSRIVFGIPRELTIPEIEEIVGNFAHSARVIAEAGFDGVQIHAAHGYLLSQFLSSATNKRTDRYGGSAENRARVVVEVIEAVKEATREFKGFAVGIKVNSADYQSGGDGVVEETVRQFRMIAEAGVDFVEVSGGTYENPEMNLGPAKSERTKAREAFFLEFASIARRELPGVPLLVTGGFTTRMGMENAVAQGDCDLVGLGRPAVLNPALPNNTIFNKEVKDQDATMYRKRNEPNWLVKMIGIKAVGAGADSAWYTKQIQVLASS